MSAGEGASVSIGFERATRCLDICDILPLKRVSAAVRNSAKYAQIVASMKVVGIIEPLVVAPDRSMPGKYLLLDGHLRLEVLKDMGETHTTCLVSTDDEAFTYNKRISRLAIVQEHRMLIKALERGVSEARLAAALNIDVKTLQQKRRLLDGICEEAADLLKDKFVPMSTFWVLKKLIPLRQIEAAELMVAMNRFTCSYARSLLAATPSDQLIESDRPKKIRGLTDDQIARMERESATLENELKLAERTYSADHLELVVAKGYIEKLLFNPRVAGYLRGNYEPFFVEFSKLTHSQVAASTGI